MYLWEGPHLKKPDVLIDQDRQSRNVLKSGSGYSGERMWTLISGLISRVTKLRYKANISETEQNLMVSRWKKSFCHRMSSSII